MILPSLCFHLCDFIPVFSNESSIYPFDILLLTSGWDVRVLGSSRPERMETDYGRRCCNELQRRWRRRRRTFLSLVRRCSSTRDQWCNRSPLQRLLDETDVLEVGTNELNHDENHDGQDEGAILMGVEHQTQSMVKIECVGHE